MKKFSFKKVAMMGVAAIMAMSTMSISAFAANIPSEKIYAMSQEETRARGFEIIDGDIYGLDGVLLIDMTNGLTPDGYALDENFAVQTPDMYEDISETDIMPLSTEIFNGGKNLNENKDGNQGVNLGDSFTASADETTAYLEYCSGEPTGVNFSIINKTRNTLVEFVFNVQPGKTSKGIGVYNSARPKDKYFAQASGYKSSGYASMIVTLK